MKTNISIQNYLDEAQSIKTREFLWYANIVKMADNTSQT